MQPVPVNRISDLFATVATTVNIHSVGNDSSSVAEQSLIGAVNGDDEFRSLVRRDIREVVRRHVGDIAVSDINAREGSVVLTFSILGAVAGAAIMVKEAYDIRDAMARLADDVSALWHRIVRNRVGDSASITSRTEIELGPAATQSEAGREKHTDRGSESRRATADRNRLEDPTQVMAMVAHEAFWAATRMAEARSRDWLTLVLLCLNLAMTTFLVYFALR